MSEKKKPIRILLVDDDDIDRQAALRYIKKEKLPYRVKTASSEEEALKALKKNNFDVALLDYDLRTATGLDILPYTGDIPAIFVTGSGNEEVAVEAMRMGASDYLIKDPERNYLTVLPITIRNVLEQKRSRDQKEKLEAHIHQVQKYDSLNTLAGSIAHSFNNLLMGVLGNLELALSNLEPDSPVRSNIEKADRAAKRVADLSKLMLTYVGQAKAESQILNVSTSVDEMATILENSVSKNISLHFQSPKGPTTVEGDPSQMRQVIMNLVNNAVEALGDKKGTITLSSGMAFYHSEDLQQPFLKEQLPEGNYVYLEVKDSGDGMDEETRDKAFDPFFTTRFKGRGMGLSAILGIVLASHGTVILNSKSGKGTSVRILLPHVEASVDAIVKKDESSVPWSGSDKVLLVDDEKMVLEVGQDMLEELGFQVLTASHGAEAIEVYKRHEKEISCVILDIIMPGMDGEETFRKLREINNELPVIFCSGYTEEQVVKRFAGIFPAPFMAKPFQLAGLGEFLRKVIKR